MLANLMKARLTPTQIALRDLPDSGRDFEFTNETGELNAILKDLIGNQSYRLSFHLSPMGNTFELRGQLQTSLGLQCSICASDFQLPLNLDVRELLIIEPALRKNDQSAKANHAHEWDPSAPDYLVLDDEVFDVGAYAHEAIALAEPLQPLCSPQAPGGCAQSREPIERPWLSYGEEQNTQERMRSNPFQVLEKMKLKS